MVFIQSLYTTVFIFPGANAISVGPVITAKFRKKWSARTESTTIIVITFLRYFAPFAQIASFCGGLKKREDFAKLLSFHSSHSFIAYRPQKKGTF